AAACTRALSVTTPSVSKITAETVLRSRAAMSPPFRTMGASRSLTDTHSCSSPTLSRHAWSPSAVLRPACDGERLDRDLPLLVGRHHEHRDLGPVGRDRPLRRAGAVAFPVDRDAQPLQAGQRPLPDPRVVLAHARG